MKFLNTLVCSFFLAQLSSGQISVQLESPDSNGVYTYRFIDTSCTVSSFALNSDADEFNAIKLPDGSLLYCSNKQIKYWKKAVVGEKGLYYDQIYRQTSEETSEPLIPYRKAKRMHYGAFVMNDESQELIVTTSSKPSGKRTYRIGLEFIPVDNPDAAYPFEYNSCDYEIGHPYLSPDRKTLYFSSNMPGGHGGADLWKSELVGDHWGQPVNLGPEINSPANEYFPHLTPDNDIVFASDRSGGVGAVDLYIGIMDASIPEVVNLGQPINSPANDFGFYLEKDGKHAFIASDRSSDQLGDNIFRLSFSEDFVQTKTGQIEIVIDSLVEIVSVPEADTVHFLFENNSAIIAGENRGLIQKMKDELMEVTMIKINGFADPSGNEDYNLKLSERRATNAQSLILELGIPSDKIRVEAHGETSRFGEKAAQNRCVEIILSY